jgi:hypothetical protein
MKDPKLEAEKAEVWQAVKALLIPLSLFVACVISAGGVFLVYNREPLGWAFLLVSVTIIVLDFVGLIRFQNSYRAKGIIVTDILEAEAEHQRAEQDAFDETTHEAKPVSH